MSYEYSKLSGKIREICGSQSEFARLIGLSERSVSLKLNGKLDWKQSEIHNICKVLKIDTSEIPLYFFNAKVQY